MEAPVEEFTELDRLTIDECFVYKLTKRTANGHRAEDWGLAKPLVTGVMKLVQCDKKLMIRIYEDKKTTMGNVVTSELVLFAECPIVLDNNMVINNFVESVVDSSRYFVLRIEEKTTKQHMFIGVGFRERQSAFDMRSTLQDFEKFSEREKLAKASPLTKQAEGGGEAEEANIEAQFDEALSLKDGQKIKISLKGTSSRQAHRENNSNGGILLPPPTSNGGILLPPPSSNGGILLPPPVVKKEVDQASVVTTDIPLEADADDDWGDFVSS